MRLVGFLSILVLSILLIQEVAFASLFQRFRVKSINSDRYKKYLTKKEESKNDGLTISFIHFFTLFSIYMLIYAKN